MGLICESWWLPEQRRHWSTLANPIGLTCSLPTLEPLPNVTVTSALLRGSGVCCSGHDAAGTKEGLRLFLSSAIYLVLNREEKELNWEYDHGALMQPGSFSL